ncbi:MAG: hypothetical protein KDK70_28665, partial [Myxococcales bacterium]|nr:hypothetical protein [Myxococcales bacterium]
LFDTVYLTGGENLLHRDDVLELCRHGAALGLRTEVISNGFWAIDVERGLAFLAPLVEAGLSTLQISIDDHHLPYVAAPRVRHALEVVRRLGLQPQLCTAIDRKEPAPPPELEDPIEAGRLRLDEVTAESFDALVAAEWAAIDPDVEQLLALYGVPRSECIPVHVKSSLLRAGGPQAEAIVARYVHPRILVHHQYTGPVGRGATLEALPRWHVDQWQDESCHQAGESPLVTAEGDVFPCCSSWANEPDMRTSRCSGGNVEEITHAIRQDPIARFMHYQGPRQLVVFLRAQGHELPEQYGNICDFCSTLLARFSRPQLEAFIEQYYQAQPHRRTFATRGLVFDAQVQDHEAFSSI